MINGQVLGLHTILPGDHTLTVYAVDKATNQSSLAVTFNVEATPQTLVQSVRHFFMTRRSDRRRRHLPEAYGKTDGGQKAKRLDTKLNAYNAFISMVEAQSGKHINTEAADMLLESVQYVIDHLH